MSTRASAPRCASCGMPLAPDAESCAVCGARVPLIARPTSGEDEARPEGDGLQADRPAASGGLASRALASGAHASASSTSTVPSVATSPSLSEAPLAAPRAPVTSPAPRGAAFDAAAAAAAREVRAAARTPRPQAVAPAEVAPVGLRVLAYAVDVLLAATVAGAGLLAARSLGLDVSVLAGVLGLLVAAAQVVAEGLTGATLGALLLGVRTVDERTGGAPGVVRAFVRQLLLGLGTLACLVGNWVVAASGVWDSGPRRRGWHDKASGTAVVRARSARQAPDRGARGRGSGGPATPTRPWTPASHAPVPGPPAAGPVAPAPGDEMFAPPAVVVRPSAGAPPAGDASAPELPTPPVASAPPAVPPAPDLVPEAPSGPPLARSAAAEADLLPPPPDGTRRTRGGDRAVRAGAAPAGATAPLSSDEDLAELEHTRVRDPESLRRRSGTLALHFDTGERVRVVGRGLVGRGPRAEDGQDILHVVVLDDAARSLSRVHAEFGPEPASAGAEPAIWVTDRGSTNGTVVVDPTGAARALPAGTRASVRAGWTVRLGDREARVEDD